jgi:hypothetical protein
MKFIKWVSFSIILASIVLFTSLVLSAHFYDGNELVADMRENDKADRGDQNADFAKAYRFLGYVIGVFDVADGISFDPPRNATIGQICTVVANFLKENPEKWNLPAANLVIQALQKAFPKK